MYYIIKNTDNKTLSAKIYFGILPKFGGTINLWFSSIIGSTSHFLAHPDTTIGTITSIHNNKTFFIYSPIYIWGGHPPHNDYIGILIASCIIATKSDNDIESCFSSPKRRKVTFFSAISFSPTTAIIGVFAKDNSRIL